MKRFCPEIMAFRCCLLAGATWLVFTVGLWAQEASHSLKPSSESGQAAGATAKTNLPPPSLKKGVGQNARGLPEAVDALRCSWYYNWTPRPFPGSENIRAEFVPMIWSGKDLDSRLAEAEQTGAKALLGFNEPDGQDQANMTVEEAVKLWPKLMATGSRLGSPAPKMTSKWLHQFMAEAKAKHLRVDFLCLHWYGDITKPDALESLRSFLEDYWNRYHLPIWLTEFSGADFKWHKRKTTLEDNARFAVAACQLLESLPYVERYAWFAVKPQGTEYSKVGLFNREQRALSPVGEAYKGK